MLHVQAPCGASRRSSAHSESAGRPPAVERLERRQLLRGGDYVLKWNEIALQAVADDHTPTIWAAAEQGGPTRTARALAIVHGAMFDAFNAIDGAYEPYLYDERAPRNTSSRAAVSQAAHDTLEALYPQQEELFDNALHRMLRRIDNGAAETRGVALGEAAADAYLEARADDHSDAMMSYTPQDVAGVFQLYPNQGEPADPLTPNWGDVTPFTMTAGDQFLADPPPAMDSPEYATAYNEVKDYGGDGVTTPTLRTDEQTHTGIFWGYDGSAGLGTPPRLYNQIARTVAKQQHNTPRENARLFALLNFAQADAGIASWGTKYTYDVWRPIRGIRQAGQNGQLLDDGNPLTDADPNWKPLGAPNTNAGPGSSNFTPPFPAYTSGHATFGAASFRTLARFYGRDDITFTFMSDEYNGVNHDVDGTVRKVKPRTFTSFSQAAEENGQSRIYLGIHWAFDKTAGIEQGNAIADQAFDNFLQPVG